MITPGKVAYHFFFRPWGAVRDSWAAGGPLEQWRTEAGRRAMEKSAEVLPAIMREGHAALEVHQLTGRRHWYQTAFCLHSLARVTPGPIRAHVYDDGSLDRRCADALRRLGFELCVHETAALEDALATRLPAGRFPLLHDRWRRYPIIRKLISVHALGETSGWKLVLDSDMLFFRAPAFVLDWFRNPDRPLYGLDVETNYGYSRTLLRNLAAAPLSERVNGGLYGLASHEIDWERVEWICDRLQQAEGWRYYLEQALLALLVAGRECAVAPPADYVTLPDAAEAQECRAVMHHYVAESKRWYFRHNWRRMLPP